MPCYTAAVSARSAPESRKSVAILARRMSAYLIDWFISVLAGTALLSIVAVVLLVTSDLNRRDAPDWSIDAALALMSLWLPCWFLYASLAWGLRCKTIGMSLAGIRVTTWAGLKPGGLESLLPGSLDGAVFRSDTAGPSGRGARIFSRHHRPDCPGPSSGPRHPRLRSRSSVTRVFSGWQSLARPDQRNLRSRSQIGRGTMSAGLLFRCAGSGQ